MGTATTQKTAVPTKLVNGLNEDRRREFQASGRYTQCAALGGLPPNEAERTETPLASPEAPITDSDVMGEAAPAATETAAEPRAEEPAAPEPVDIPAILESRSESDTPADEPVAVQPEGGDDHAETGDEALLPDAQSLHGGETETETETESEEGEPAGPAEEEEPKPVGQRLEEGRQEP